MGPVLAAEESISRWYGICGECINYGLSTYVGIDKNPYNGLYIKILRQWKYGNNDVAETCEDYGRGRS